MLAPPPDEQPGADSLADEHPGAGALAERYRFGAFELVVGTQQLSCGGRPLRLRQKCFDLLLYLLRRADRAVSKQELVEALWPNTSVHPNSLAVAIRGLRDALQNAPEPLIPAPIETLIGHGYRFRADALNGVVRAAPSRPSAHANTAFVGRAEPLSVLDVALQRALDGRGQMLLLSGEPGIGKSTLLDHFLQHHVESVSEKTSAPLVLRGQCLPLFGASEPLLPFIDGLGELLESSQRAVIGCFTRHAPQWMNLFPNASPDASAGSEHDPHAPTTVATLSRQYVAAVRAVSALQPIIVALEDLHWADAATLELFQRLAAQAGRQRLLLLGTVRPSEARLTEGSPQPTTAPAAAPSHGGRLSAAALLRRVHTTTLGKVLELSPLTQVEVEHYLEARLGSALASPQHAAELWKRTEGLPLFIDRLLPVFADSFVAPSATPLVDAQNADGQRAFPLEAPTRAACQHEARQDQSHPQLLPSSLTELFEEQLQRLETEQLELLNHASVRGRVFDCALVAALTTTNELHCEQQLDELARVQDLVYRVDDVQLRERRSARFAFRHVLVRDHVYARLATQQRLTLHLAVARTLHARCRAEDHAGHAEVALHYERAGEPELAVLALLRAGEACDRHWLQARALEHFERASRLLAQARGPRADAAAFMLAQATGWAHNVSGHVREARASFTQARTKLTQLERNARAPETQLTLDEVFAHFSTPWTDVATRRTLVAMPNQSRDLGLSGLFGETYHAECVVLANSQLFRRLLECASEMARYAERTGNAPRRCEARSWQALALLELGRLGEADRALREGQALAEASNHPRTLALLRMSLARLLLLRGEASAAREQAQRALAGALNAPDVTFSLWLLGDVLARLDDLQGALEAYTRAASVQRQATGREAPNLGGWVAQLLGDRARAMQLDRQALRTLGPYRPRLRGRSWRSLAIAHAAAEEQSATKQQLQRIVNRLSSRHAAHTEAARLGADARCALAYLGGDFVRIAHLAQRWLDQARATGAVESAIQAQHWLCHAAWHSGDLARAQQHLEQVRAQLERCPIPLLAPPLASLAERLASERPTSELPLLAVV